MGFASRFGIGCCCNGPGPPPPPPCTIPVTVHVTDTCHSGGLSGVTVVVRKQSDGTTVASGTTDATGDYSSVPLPPGAYNVTMTYGGIVRTSPVVIDSTCTAPFTVPFILPQASMDFVVQGCNGWIEGAVVRVYQSGTLIAGPATSLGSLDAPPFQTLPFARVSDGTGYSITVDTIEPQFNPPGPHVAADGTCSVTLSPGTPNLAGGYNCCGAAYFRQLPYGPTLNCSVGGFSLTLTGTGGGAWSGTLSVAVAGATDCAAQALGTVNACLHVGWACGTLTIDYLGCTGSGPALNKARASTCDVVTNITISSAESSHVSDPLVSSGSFASGPLPGPWTVSG